MMLAILAIGFFRNGFILSKTVENVLFILLTLIYVLLLVILLLVEKYFG
jgi:hypothetical protein